MKKTAYLLALLLFVLFMFACSSGDDDEVPADGDSDDDVSESENNGENDTDGDAELSEESENGENAEDTEQLPERDLLAVKLGEGQPAIGGPDAAARAGDFLLKNSKVRFIIQDEGPSRSWVPYGGSIIDADVLREGEGYDMIDEISPITGFIKAFRPEKVEIIDDGESGEKAHVRATGVLAGIPIVDFALPLACVPSAVVLDYVLYPDVNYVEITTTITPEDRSDIDLGDGIVWSNRVRILTPGFGWGVNGLAAHGAFDVQMAVSNKVGPDGRDIAYGFMPKEGQLTIATDLADILPYMGFSDDRVKGGNSRSYTRYFIVADSISGIQQTCAQLRQTAIGTLNVTVSVADEQDAEEIFELEAVDSNGKVAGFAHARVGVNELKLPPGDYTLRIGQLGRPWTDGTLSVSVNADAATEADIEVPATGRITYTVGGDHFDGTVKERIPARISVQAGQNAAAESGIIRREFTASGEGVFLLEPGEYTITVSRGYEYEICQESISLAAGANFELDCFLERSVDSSGWVAGDLHIHTERSIDAVVPVQDRVTQLAAVGLERMPITDHDVISVLDPYVDEVGVREYISLIAGDEVSPIAAHSNGFPITPRPDRDTYFGVQWFGDYDSTGCALENNPQYPAIWQQMREIYESRIIQINHPRSNSQGFFNTFSYDPIVGVDSFEAGDFDFNWDAMELINANDVGDALNYSLADWFSFFNQGAHKAGTAVSDCHNDSCPGDARSFIRTGEDDPSLVTEDMFVDAIKNLRVQAASGPFVTMNVGEAEIGDTADLGGDGSFKLHVKVQAPTWMPLDWIRVVVNGDIVAAVDADQLQSGVVRYDSSFDLTVDKDSWIVVLAGAPQKRLAPVSPSQPVLTIANPIFVNLEGDGYEAPGLPDADHAAAAFAALAALSQ